MNIFPSFKNRVDTPSRVKSFSTEKRKFVFYRPKIEKKKRKKFKLPKWLYGWKEAASSKVMEPRYKVE